MIMMLEEIIDMDNTHCSLKMHFVTLSYRPSEWQQSFQNWQVLIHHQIVVYGIQKHFLLQWILELSVVQLVVEHIVHGK